MRKKKVIPKPTAKEIEDDLNSTSFIDFNKDENNYDSTADIFGVEEQEETEEQSSNEDLSQDEISELNWEIHVEKSKVNKIFNNSYNDGENLKEPGEYEYGKSLQVDPAYSDRYSENYNPSDHVINTVAKRQVESCINNIPELKKLLFPNTNLEEKKRFNKKEINDIFTIVFNDIKDKNEEYSFINLFDIISKYVDINYKKLFDLLDYQYKEMLILELNEQYGLLDNYDNLNNFF